MAPNITIYTGYHDVGSEERRAGKGHNGYVKIGDGSWICGSTIILPNIIVGRGTLVAAGSVVHKHVADNTMVAGNRIIRVLE